MPSCTGALARERAPSWLGTARVYLVHRADRDRSSSRSSSSNGSSSSSRHGHGPLVALCWSGEFRNADHPLVVSTMEDHVHRAFGGRQRAFFYLEAPEQECTASSCARGYNPPHEGLDWDKVSDAQVAAAAATYACVEEFFYGTPPRWTPLSRQIANRTLCALGWGGEGYHAEQWQKVQMVFRMVTAHEMRHGVRFDWLLRMRTDLVFFAPLPSHLNPNLTSSSLHLPLGMVSNRVSFNDHLAIVPRNLAEVYFDMVDEQDCEANASALLHGKRVRQGHGAYAARFSKAHATTQLWPLGYAPFRPSSGLGCWRLLYQPKTAAAFWQACLAVGHLHGVNVSCLDLRLTQTITGPQTACVREQLVQQSANACVQVPPEKVTACTSGNCLAWRHGVWLNATQARESWVWASSK